MPKKQSDTNLKTCCMFFATNPFQKPDPVDALNQDPNYFSQYDRIYSSEEEAREEIAMDGFQISGCMFMTLDISKKEAKHHPEHIVEHIIKVNSQEVEYDKNTRHFSKRN